MSAPEAGRAGPPRARRMLWRGVRHAGPAGHPDVADGLDAGRATQTEARHG